MGLLQDDLYGYGPAPAPTEAELDRALIKHLTKGGLLGVTQRMGTGLLSDTVDWLAGGARAGAEPTISIMRGDDLDQPLLPTPESGGKSRLGAAASAINPHLLPGAPPGALGSFGGIRARTADKAKLAEAKELLEKGASEAEIRGRTGWWKGLDGEWRFEIPDNNLRITADGFEHPELFAAYPDMKGTDIKRFPYDEKEKITGHLGRDHIALADNLSDEEVRSVLAHELQHRVQDNEGFSPGASTRTPAVQDAAIEEFTQVRADAKRIAKEYDQSLSDWMRKNGGLGGWFGPNKEQLAQFHEQYPDLAAAHEQAQDFLNHIKTRTGLWNVLSEMEFNAYQRTLGETEARAVQDRLDYTPEQRRMTPPLDTQVGPGLPAEDPSRVIVLPPYEAPAPINGVLDWFR